MVIYLFATIASFLLNSILIVPFINFLYKSRFRRIHQETKDPFNKPTPIYDEFHLKKAGTPVGGGMLIVGITVILFSFFTFLFRLFNRQVISNYASESLEITILLFTFISFAILGLFDDLNKMFFWKKSSFIGLRLKHKLLLEVVLALIISCALYFGLKIEFINIPFFGVFRISYFYILFATFTIVAFANAVNIADGLDGLSTGVLMIALSAFWVIARSILDVPTSIFIGVWLGGLLAFLYFNIYPARIFLGDVGSLSFGAMFAVIGLVLGKSFVLPIIGAVFVVEIATSLLQLLSRRFRGKKLFPVAPAHLWLQLRGWPEPKIVMRAWILTVVFAILGLMIAFLN